LAKEAFEVDANLEYIKLEHNAMILDPEAALHIEETLADHIWIMCVNKTSVPFFTSDDPLIRIPHKRDEFYSYSGFASEKIEIAFPISSSLLLCMYDKNEYGHLFCDRQFYGADLVAGVPRIKIVHHIFQDHQHLVVLVDRIHTVVEGDEADAHRGEHDVRIFSGLDVVPSKAAHVLDDPGAD